MDAGRVIAEGPPAAVVSQAAVIDAYIGASGQR
jgi:ABC-type branched-subunit amino acid transport system ATPase component